MNKRCKRSVNAADKSEVRKTDTTTSSNNNEDIVRLTMTIDAQKETIDELSSRMSEMEVDFEVQCILRDEELASLKEKCEEYRQRIVVLEGIEPNRSEKSVPENQTALADSCVITSAKLDEKPATTDAVDIVEQKANIAQVVHRNNEPVAVFEDTFNTLNLYNKKQCTEDKMNAYLDTSPVCALQELCLSRGWTLPKYEFFEEGDSKTFTYSVECTLMDCTVKVGGLIKRQAKRQAATLMYHKVKNVKNIKELSLKEKSATCVPANNVGANGTLADSCVASSARLDEQPVIAAAVANNTQRAAKVQVVPKNNEVAVTIKDNTANDIKKQCTDEHFNASPICALQELCMSRKWSLPVYEFFKEGDNKTFTYTVECRVQSCTVRVEGVVKKKGKRQAATMMYHKVLNI